jgi:hypothetical protein
MSRRQLMLMACALACATGFAFAIAVRLVMAEPPRLPARSIVLPPEMLDSGPGWRRI